MGKYTLDDGSELMASFDDVDAFFKEHKIVGRRIVDVLPSEYDYRVRNLNDIDDVWNVSLPCGIMTDGRLCFLFEDGDTLEIEFCGEGPVILGFNTANVENYPKPDGLCYTLRTMFSGCLGRRICEVKYARSDARMIFPEYHGIDMSADDEGVREIRFMLDDMKQIVFKGNVDWFDVSLLGPDGDDWYVPARPLLEELSEEGLENALYFDGNDLRNLFGPGEISGVFFEKEGPVSISDQSACFDACVIQEGARYIELKSGSETGSNGEREPVVRFREIIDFDKNKYPLSVTFGKGNASVFEKVITKTRPEFWHDLIDGVEFRTGDGYLFIFAGDNDLTVTKSDCGYFR